MPADPRAGAPASDATAAGYRSNRGIEAIKRSLGFGDAEEALVREAGELLSGEVEGWVDAFYLRLLTDPAAMRMLDDARVIRLKRSLAAWFHELFALPFDEAYERARSSIGLVHVRMNMPLHLMVSAFGGLRRDVAETLKRLRPAESPEREAMVAALDLALDLELSLMLEAYRRQSRVRSRRQARAVYAAQATRRMLKTLEDRIDAALCYAELAATADESRLGEVLARLRDVLRGLSSGSRSLSTPARAGLDAPRSGSVESLCVEALDNVPTIQGVEILLEVVPSDLEAQVFPEAVGLALEELLQNAFSHAGASRLELRAYAGEHGGVTFEVTDDGAGWDAGIRQVEDVRRLGAGAGLALSELVASLHEGDIQLFRAPEGGAGVRLLLGVPESERSETIADLRLGP